MSSIPTTPTIEIHLADDDYSQELQIDAIQSSAYSPKSPSPMDSDDDDFRPVHLLPPPTGSPLPRPSKPAVLPADKKGIDHERFAQLLKTSRERSAMRHGRKESVELRKQVTLKVHTTKALERRALFLSKVQSAPTPEAASTPVTPPESPAIFHFTLPSPGMQSPLAVFEKLASENDKAGAACRVEEVDFKARVKSTGFLQAVDLALPAKRKQQPRVSPSHALPSLDQITARLATKVASQAGSDVAPSVSAVGGIKVPPKSLGIARSRPGQIGHRRTPSSPLATQPVFTMTVKDEDDEEETKVEPVALPVEKPSPAPAPSSRLPTFLQKRISRERIEIPAPAPPPAPETPTIQITEPSPVQQKRPSQTLPSGSIVMQSAPVNRRRPTSAAPPPQQLPPPAPFEARLTPMRLSVPHAGAGVSSETRKQRGLDMVEKLRRRSSAPAALPPVVDLSQQHRVLSLKGGF